MYKRQLYAWGGNDRGELGVGTQGGDGSVENCHFAIGLPQVVTALAGKPVRQVAANVSHTLVLTEAGEVYAMGTLWHAAPDWTATGRHDANSPVLVEELTPWQVVEISAGEQHCLARTADGESSAGVITRRWGTTRHPPNANGLWR